jgi:hypothetical protein
MTTLYGNAALPPHRTLVPCTKCGEVRASDRFPRKLTSDSLRPEGHEDLRENYRPTNADRANGDPIYVPDATARPTNPRIGWGWPKPHKDRPIMRSTTRGRPVVDGKSEIQPISDDIRFAVSILAASPIAMVQQMDKATTSPIIRTCDKGCHDQATPSPDRRETSCTRALGLTGHPHNLYFMARICRFVKRRVFSYRYCDKESTCRDSCQPFCPNGYSNTPPLRMLVMNTFKSLGC